MNPVLAALRDGPHCSVSAIKSYLMCPMKYAHRYVRKTEASHRAVALVLGISVHEALAAFYSHMEKGDPPVEILLDVFSDCWRKSMVGDPPVKCDDIGVEKDKAVAMLEVFHAEAPRPVEVIGVEVPFGLSVDNPKTGEELEQLLVGSIDAVVVDEQGRTVIVESKTAKRRWSADQLVYDLQPTIYQMAVREMEIADAPVLQYHFLLKTKKPAFETAEIVRSPQQEWEARLVISQVLRAVDAGIFYPVRGWMCGDCEFAYCCG